MRKKRKINAHIYEDDNAESEEIDFTEITLETGTNFDQQIIYESGSLKSRNLSIRQSNPLESSREFWISFSKGCPRFRAIISRTDYDNISFELDQYEPEDLDKAIEEAT